MDEKAIPGLEYNSNEQISSLNWVCSKPRIFLLAAGEIRALPSILMFPGVHIPVEDDPNLAKIARSMYAVMLPLTH